MSHVSSSEKYTISCITPTAGFVPVFLTVHSTDIDFPAFALSGIIIFETTKSAGKGRVTVINELAVLLSSALCSYWTSLLSVLIRIM